MTLGDLIVGLGTLALAGFTYWLGRSARTEGSQVAQQVELETKRMDVETEPYVVPAPDADWTERGGQGRYSSELWRTLLPVKNVGPGGALNVLGELDFGPPSGVKVRIIPTSIGPGEAVDMRVHWASEPRPRDEWKRVKGTLDYDEINGDGWRTTFLLDYDGEYRHITIESVFKRVLATG